MWTPNYVNKHGVQNKTLEGHLDCILLQQHGTSQFASPFQFQPSCISNQNGFYGWQNPSGICIMAFGCEEWFVDTFR